MAKKSKKIMYCGYNPNDRKYYCSTKTKYGIVETDLCEMILSHEDLFNYIKNNQDKYTYSLPFLVADSFRKRLEGESEKND